MRRFIDIMETFEGDEPNWPPQSLIDVAEHFVSYYDDLLDDDEYYQLEIGELDFDETFALEIIRRNYVSGTCGAFAIALHDKTGFPLVGINGTLHIAVREPSGKIVDFAGTNSLQKVLERYGFGKNTPITELSREFVVDHVLMGETEHNDEWNEISVAKWVMNKLGKW